MKRDLPVGASTTLRSMHLILWLEIQLALHNTVLIGITKDALHSP